MTYAKNSSINANDFNNFAGTTDVGAGSAANAQNKAGYLYGVGYGDRGYGLNSISLVAKNSGDTIGQEWQNLRTILNSLAQWTGSAQDLIPPSSAFNTGSNIIAHERDAPSTNSYDIQDVLSTLDTNRLNFQIGNMTLSNNASSSTRNSTWGAGSSGITCEFSVSFSNEDAARYFFNTGGDIRLALNHPSTLTPRDSSWNTILDNLVVSFKANTSSRLSGSFGVSRDVGYYQLTTNYQTILDGTNTGVSAYSVNDFDVSAKTGPFTGTNGSKGSIVYFKVTLADEQSNAFSDIVQPGTSVSLSHLRATNLISITPPTTAVVTPL